MFEGVSVRQLLKYIYIYIVLLWCLMVNIKREWLHVKDFESLKVVRRISPLLFDCMIVTTTLGPL